MRFRCQIVLFILFLLFGSCYPKGNVPKNIILMIGDGMGVSHITAAHTYKGRLELEKFKHVGLLLTHAWGEDYIIDSGAAATALSTGVKTFDGAIAVGPDSSSRETVFERAKRAGLKTGIVVVCSITHATPASFVAHVPSRKMEFEIAEQIADGETDLLLGSGWGWFLPTNLGGRRNDGKNLIESMSRHGYTYLSTDSAFRILNINEPEKLIGLFADNHVGEAQTRKPSLREMTKFALEFLSASGAGFFLMVEGSQIDWAAHDNNSNQVLIETADFDDAIGEVLRFAEKQPETLVIVTADHETGGYSLNGGSLSDRTVVGGFSTKGHTAAMVPVFALGPGAEEFTGIIENTTVGRVLLKFLALREN
jgi:alkaline phosphatase